MSRNDIVTPYTEPDRWLPEEKALFDQGRCSRQDFTGSGQPVYCGKSSRPSASFGYCSSCEQEFLEDHWPDGSPRR